MKCLNFNFQELFFSISPSGASNRVEGDEKIIINFSLITTKNVKQVKALIGLLESSGQHVPDALRELQHASGGGGGRFGNKRHGGGGGGYGAPKRGRSDGRVSIDLKRIYRN